MAGTITMSLTQRLDNSTHLPLSGGLMYFIQAGTTATPQNAFQDSALTLPYANPLTLDSGGNIPQLFFADGVIKVRITNRLGVQQLVQDNIQVTGASSGGGGGGTVDPTTILAAGDIKLRYGTGVLTGFVRANGRTIGSATSGATERANSDAQTLFEYLWTTDSSLAVSGGRGGSANSDWVSNKTIVLPDWRGRVPVGMDDMGNSVAGVLTSTYYSNSPIVLGNPGGGQSSTLLTANLPAYTPEGTQTSYVGQTAALQGSGASYSVFVLNGTGNQGNNIDTAAAFAGTAQGGTSTPFSNVMPARTLTFYMKL